MFSGEEFSREIESHGSWPVKPHFTISITHKSTTFLPERNFPHFKDPVICVGLWQSRDLTESCIYLQRGRSFWVASSRFQVLPGNIAGNSGSWEKVRCCYCSQPVRYVCRESSLLSHHCSCSSPSRTEWPVLQVPKLTLNEISFKIRRYCFRKYSTQDALRFQKTTVETPWAEFVQLL